MRAFIKIIVILLFAAYIHSQSNYKNVMISNADEPNELCIVFSPYDNNYIAAASNLDGFYFSSDAGLSWSVRAITNSEYGVWGDPCLVFDATGALYYFHLASNTKYWYDRIVCQKSFDGGISWEEPGNSFGVNSPHLQDKEWVSCDLTYSPYRNNLYAVWTQCGQANSENASGNPDDSYGSYIFFSHSSNGGVTWSSMQRISEKRGSLCTNVDSTVLGAVNCIGINGEMYVSWVSPHGLMFDKTTDAGQTWMQNDVTAAGIPGGFKYKVPGIYRTFGFPSIACDHSFSSLRGTIYICWADQRSGEDDTDVWLIKSTDDGLFWSTPKRVNDDLTKTHQFFSWVTVDPSNGYLYVVFYDRRNYFNTQTDVYLARSADGGETFTNERISQSPFEPDEATFFGDYINIAARDGVIRPVWTRLEGNKLSAWTAIINE